MVSGSLKLCPILFIAVFLGCHQAPQLPFSSLYQRATTSFQQGDLVDALRDVNAGLSLRGLANNERARLKLLKAEIYFWQARNSEAAELLNQLAQGKSLPRELEARRLALLGSVEGSMQQLQAADKALAQAKALNQPESPETTCRLLLAEGKVAALRGEFAAAERFFREALITARREHLPLSEASALGNLGMVAMRRKKFADAADWFSSSLALAKSRNQALAYSKLTEDLGWSYLEMGDLERAERYFKEAETIARRTDSVGVELTLLMNVGETQFFERHYADARHTYESALTLAEKLQDKQQRVYATNNLAKLAILTGNWQDAQLRNDAGIADERSLGDRESMRYSELYSGQIALGRRQFAKANAFLTGVISSPDAPAAVKAEGLETLASLEDQENKPVEAERSYRRGIAIMDKARQDLGRTEFELSYPIFAETIYDDYVHFLIRRGRSNQALAVVEQHRARTLMAGLSSETHPSWDMGLSLKAMRTVTQDGHVILSYWLGVGQSYVWLIEPTGIHMAVLPDQDQVAAAVKRYQARLTSSFGTGGLENSGGQELYRMLVEPVGQWIPHAATVTVIPDGALCSLNFETLVVPTGSQTSPIPATRETAAPHYWIEDVSVREASSLSMLTQRSRLRGAGSAAAEPALLLVGDPKTPANYPELSHAHAEVAAVAKHFPRDHEALLTGAGATPAAYFAAKPEDYAMIHFVAHGTASRTSPLDSAVVLSDDGKSYNLFARQIMEHPIHARLVTISACDSAGDRVYSAEGLVGMSWAFLRAGAQGVVAALWEVNDASTPHFMDLFYGEVAHGRDPALALRDAKLDMLHSGTIYAKPFYWAPFVLYQGH